MVFGNFRMSGVCVEKVRKWPFLGKKLSPETPISAKNGHFWSKNLSKWTQIGPNAKVPSKPAIPLILGWGPKQWEALIVVNKRPKLLTPLPSCPSGAWKKFYNLPKWTNFWSKHLPKSTQIGLNAQSPFGAPHPINWALSSKVGRGINFDSQNVNIDNRTPTISIGCMETVL
jgi:hypothetical protein